MDLCRPKSGNLRIQGAEERQRSSKYEERRLSKEICKSINIMPIKIQNQHPVGSEKETIKTVNYNISKHNFVSTEQLKKRKTLLSIKSKHSLRIDDEDFINNFLQEDEVIISENKIPRSVQKRTSIEMGNILNMNLNVDDDSEKIFEFLRNKKEIMMLDHNRLVMEASKFKSLLNDFHSKFREIKTDRDSLEERVNKYEFYFKEMRLKHVPDESELNSLMETNHQLKILNLEKKVETLNYIIKQYRTGNNEEVKNFEQRLKEFKPNIEKELTEKLAESNEKYEKLLKKVEFFESQCKNNLNLNWHELVDEFESTKKSNEKHLQYISELTIKLEELNQLMEENQEKMKKIQLLEDETLLQKEKIELLNDKKHELEEMIEEKDKRIDELNHLYEETTFKLEGLQNLQFRIDNKEKTIKRNTIVINRLQCENIELKSKMDTVLAEFQQKLFCEKTLQETLLKANNDIHELTNRLHETFVDFGDCNSAEVAKEKEFFIGHLFEKVKSSYNEIITEYQNQLKIISAESEKWKATFEMITKGQEIKIKQLERINEEIKVIHDKKLRCQGHFNNLSNEALDQSRKECINCKHFIAYWGQLENSYTQLRKISSDIIEMQSMNLTSTKPISAQNHSE